METYTHTHTHTYIYVHIHILSENAHTCNGACTHKHENICTRLESTQDFFLFPSCFLPFKNMHKWREEDNGGKRKMEGRGKWREEENGGKRKMEGREKWREEKNGGKRKMEGTMDATHPMAPYIEGIQHAGSGFP